MTFIRIAGSTSQEKGENFEKAIANYLKMEGFKKTNKSRHSSSGYEVDFRGKIGNIPVTVECKAHKSKIDVPLIAAFFGKYTIDRYENQHYQGIFFSLSSLTDSAKQFYESIKKNEPDIPFEIITADNLITNLTELPDPPLEANYTQAEREFDKLVKDYNIILNYDISIVNKENNIFLEYLNDSYYWICIVLSIKGNYFLILDKKANIPKDHKSLAEQLRISESLLTNVKYLLSEKVELNSDRLLETIVYCEKNNEWINIFKNTIDILSKNGCLDILSELFKNPTVRVTVSEKEVIRKIENISEDIQNIKANWKEEYPSIARCFSELLDFAFEYNITHDKESAVGNLKALIKIHSKNLVFDKSRRAECLDKIFKYIGIIIKIDDGKLSNYFETAYNSSNEALNILNSELMTEIKDKDKFTSKFAKSDYLDPKDLIEIYECQKKLLEKARDEENILLIDKEVSELTNKIDGCQIRLPENTLYEDNLDNDERGFRANN